MSMFHIATTTVGAGGVSGIVFNNIPQQYTHLQLRIFGRSGNGSVDVNTPMQFNGDTAANYRVHYLGGNGSITFAGDFGSSQSSLNVGWAPGASATSNSFATQIVDILDYTNTSKNKTVKCLNGFDNNGSGGLVGLWSGLWMSTAAINRIDFSVGGNYVQNTVAVLYGLTTSQATGA